LLELKKEKGGERKGGNEFQIICGDFVKTF